ncbi:hypothetical protein A2276_01735 [candidate division WOR-1 bacterium RIFOXYA12_FULL_43_27]|uniref:Outer membrane protein beta-barrel domain-containing protein n=1 Tax=candidate division WOR-1 bacterium RIFOXYC2_FULL_46_14 TaxID=1802587 RepID=A0A1F4U6V3_UNCSA|nr:MAG: hypothetical protein A2276_01735 [candidate division WOR-1 bacterium RIFOXYA12_FULL_43_27]OGC19554.1 MAG: hypothetical protein A2292_02595 [candidate division WOR-1 bacterium RIFOXYB2_FULL_46_45]OGC30542.1 MAG: hypothetical protein A2232_02595 [candidate division WOR-1 bacterium RIFOXYA2_FULL_46_56]OGC40609.1 MAG: hypothetical protein A2438_06310 [candidate division WOR-1 bacterium RIFOXYC2_FULL_46_14]
MKKLIALIAVFAFVLTIAAPMADAATVKKTTKVVKKKVVKKVPAKKVAPKAIRPIAPPPVAVPPPPPPARVAPAPSSGLFGWGLNTDINVGYLMNKSILFGRGNIVLPDPLGLGSIVGLSADSVKYKLGLGVFSGNDTNDVSFKGIPIYLDGVINLPADLLGGIKSYLSGGINYLVYRSGQTSGSIGGQVAFGIAGNIGLGSDTCLELGYSILRTGDSKTPRSAKGLTISVGQAITL